MNSTKDAEISNEDINISIANKIDEFNDVKDIKKSSMKTLFFWDTYCANVERTTQLVGTWCVITGLYIMYLIFVGPYVWDKISPTAIFMSGGAYLFTMLNFFAAAFRDPGIIPRAFPCEQEFMNNAMKNDDTIHWNNRAVMIKGQRVVLKYCVTCHIYRPPRASHCRICDHCVDTFDHHCPYLGNCIGRRNYRVFYMFVLFLAILVSIVFITSVIHLYTCSQNEKLKAWQLVQNIPVTVLLVFVCGGTVWSIIGLVSFHAYLIALGTNTYEKSHANIKLRSANRRATNPYSRGNCCKNCCYFLFGPLPPSFYKGPIGPRYKDATKSKPQGRTYRKVGVANEEPMKTITNLNVPKDLFLKSVGTNTSYFEEDEKSPKELPIIEELPVLKM